MGRVHMQEWLRVHPILVRMYERSSEEVKRRYETATVKYGGHLLDKQVEPRAGHITFSPLDSISCALTYHHDGVGVLNFANPDVPALGPPHAHTQEEDIMRRTNLGFYLYQDIHTCRRGKERLYPFYPRRRELLCTPDVIPLEARHRRLFIITAAALQHPKTGPGQTYANAEDEQCMRDIIESVHKVAIHHGVRVLVLGAFGCGEFACPLRETARIMMHISYQFRYLFDEIVYALPDPKMLTYFTQNMIE